MKVKSENIFKSDKRYIFLVIVVIIFSFLLLFRLFFLQILQGQYYFSLSEKNRIRIKRIPFLRGVIYDRDKNVIAENIPGFSLFLNREDIKKNNLNINNILKIISKLTGTEVKDLKKILEKHKKEPLYIPIKLISNLHWEIVSKLESYSFFIPGIEIDFDPIRHYPLKEAAAHITGYVLEADKLDIKKYHTLVPGDYTGKTGLEKEYNKFLIGQSGKKIVEVDAKGRELQIISEVSPKSGLSLILNIRNDLQKYAYNLLKGKAGTIIAMNPNNGEVLCYVSAPSFDPNDFSKGISSEEWQALLSNKLKPLNSKGIAGLYPPGSTFKVITALAALMENAVSSKDKVVCNGIYQVGDTKYRCWKKYGHGEISMIRAIKESCDVYFYDVGIKVGIDNIYKWGSLFGLGYKTGIDLPREKSGLLPSKEWKEKIFHIQWYPGETPPVAIGQGYTLVTPMQMLIVYSAIANGGYIFEPHILRDIVDAKGNILKNISPKVLRYLNIPREKLKIIREGLREVVNEIHGTAYAQRLKNFEFSGKTGTAQVSKLGEKREKDISKIPYSLRDHAWFVAYAPSNKPVFAVIALVEHGGHGGSAAAPLVKEMISYYFHLKESK